MLQTGSYTRVLSCMFVCTSEMFFPGFGLQGCNLDSELIYSIKDLTTVHSSTFFLEGNRGVVQSTWSPFTQGLWTYTMTTVQHGDGVLRLHNITTRHGTPAARGPDLTQAENRDGFCLFCYRLFLVKLNITTYVTINTHKGRHQSVWISDASVIRYHATGQMFKGTPNTHSSLDPLHGVSGEPWRTTSPASGRAAGQHRQARVSNRGGLIV